MARFRRPPFGPDMTAIEADRGPVNRPNTMKLGQQQPMQIVPDTGFGPTPETSPAGHAGAESELGRQMPPRYTGIEHEQDALQALPIIHRSRSALTRTVLR